MNIFNIHAQHKIKHFDLSVKKIPRMHALELALSQPETIQPIIVTAAERIASLPTEGKT